MTRPIEALPLLPVVDQPRQAERYEAMEEPEPAWLVRLTWSVLIAGLTVSAVLLIGRALILWGWL